MSIAQLTSSPLSSIESSQRTTQLSSSQPSQIYRTTEELPFELAQHIQTYLEESLFTQAFGLLYSIASSSISSHARKPISIPAPQYLSVTATLSVHPTLTSRTTSRDKWEQANAALRFLRLVLKTAGPVNANFAESFKFHKYDLMLPTQTEWRERQDSNSGFTQRLSIPYADTDGLFTLAEDFWAVLGWSLNCSCLQGMYISRWEWWSPWFEFMLDVLERDWELRMQTDDCHESLIWQYIDGSARGNARGRRILRAIFADGSTSSLNEFREIFRKELKEPKSDRDKLKKREVKVNVEAEIYGDYMAADDSADSSDDGNDYINTRQPRSSKRQRTRTPSNRRHLFRPAGEEDDLDEKSADDRDDITHSLLGSPQSIGIRLRLMALLVRVSSRPELITTKTERNFPDLHDLFTLYVEFIKPLPLPTFQQFISTSVFTDEIFPSETRRLLGQFLLQRLLESSAPTEHNLLRRELSQQILITNYLPFAAAKANIDAQCRANLVLEALVRGLAGDDKLRKTRELVAAVEAGVDRRLAKIPSSITDVKGKHDGDEVYNILQDSGQRMKALVQDLKPANPVSESAGNTDSET